MRGRRVLAATTLVTLSLALPATGHRPAQPARPCPGGSGAVKNNGAWTVIASPLPSVTSHAAGGLDGQHLLVSDGQTVKRSADGGCTWEPSYQASAAQTVARVVYPDAGARAFLLLDAPGGAAGGALMASDDRGKTWHASGSGLPAVGGLRQLVGSGDRLYLTTGVNDALADSVAGAAGDVYASRDGGRTWGQASSGAQVERLAVDPANADVVYVVRADHALQASRDGAKTFADVPVPDAPWTDLALARAPDAPLTIALVAAASRTARPERIVASQDGGKTFHELPVEGVGPVTGVTFGNSASQLVLAVGSSSSAFRHPGMMVFDPGEKRFRDVDDLELGSLREVAVFPYSSGVRGHSGYSGIQLRRDAPEDTADAPDVIARYDAPDPAPGALLVGKPPCAAPGAGTRADFSDERHPTADFEPGSIDLKLQPGAAQRVPLAAALSAVRTPLDVFVLLDVSDSMDPAINGLTCSIERLAKDVRRRGIDARFGIGSYLDKIYWRYRREIDLTDSAAKLHAALDGLHTLRGAGEPFRSALFQAATGAGLEYHDPEGGDVVVPPGQGASYRGDALRTAIVISDEPYDENMPAEPAREDVVKALKDRGILAIGMQLIVRYAPIDAEKVATEQLVLGEQLKYFARETGALAPPGGVDCDGGGAPDLRPGDPLVCPIPTAGIQESMGDALQAILDNLTDVQDTRIVPVKTGGLDVHVEGASASGVNVKKPSRLDGAAVVSCTEAQAGKRYELSFAVQVGGRRVGVLPASAVCGALAVPAAAVPRKPRPATRDAAPAAHKPVKPTPAAASVPPAPPGPAPHAAVAAAPPPPPPAPAPVAGAPSVSGATAQASAAANAAAPAAAPAPGQPGLEAAPDRPPAAQVATVHADGPGAAAAREHAMVAVRARDRRDRPELTAALLTLGISTVAGFGALAVASDRARRRALAPARQRSGR